MLTAQRKQPINDTHFWYKIPATHVLEKNPERWDYRCSLCEQEVIHVSKSWNGRVTHFRHKNKPGHRSISESVKHQEIKKWLYQKLDNTEEYTKVELEKIIDSDNEQIADIYVEHRKHGKIAVEIQCSVQSVQDFKERTQKYNDKEISVLWIVDADTYLPTKTTNNVEGHLYRDQVKWLQSKYYGRFYTIKQTQEEYVLKPVRLTQKTKEQVVKKCRNCGKLYCSDCHVGFDETIKEKPYKTIAAATTGQIPDYNLFSTASCGYNIARFYDKKWWGDAA